MRLLAVTVVLLATACEKPGSLWVVTPKESPAPRDGDHAPVAPPRDEHGDDETKTGAAHDDHDEHGEAEGKLLVLGSDALRDLHLSTAPAEARPDGDVATALGELRINEDAQAVVGSPLEARLVKLLARPGDDVARGAPLAVMMSPELGKARAEVKAAEARMRAAEAAVRREEELVKEGIASQRGVIEARVAAEQARLAAESSRMTLTALGLGEEVPSSEEDLSRFTVNAPIAGSVIERTAVLGQMAHPDDVLFRVANLRTLWLMAHVFERDAVRLKKGNPAVVTFAAWPGERFKTQVDLVGSVVDAALRSADVLLVVPNDAARLKPGMSASVAFTLPADGKRQILTVPTAAVQRVDGSWCVYLPKGEGRFEQREVARGRDFGGEVEILEGLERGEDVVVEGSFVLRAQVGREHASGEHHHH